MADNDVGSEDAQSLLFRFGFICFAAADGPRNNDETWAAIRRSWPKIQLGEFIIHRHPETRLSHQSHGDKHTVLIGDAFMVGEGDPLALAAGATSPHPFDETMRCNLTNSRTAIGLPPTYDRHFGVAATTLAQWAMNFSTCLIV